MKLIPALLSLAAAAAFALPAAAQTFTGDTTGGSIWNRPFESLSGLSSSGANTRFEVITFTVTVSGSYTFQNTAVQPALWDNFTFVYGTAFNPATPLVNGLIGNDDNPDIGLSGFTTALTAGTDYFYVTTGFAPADVGSYSLEVTGPGLAVASVVPEPGTYGLLGLGLAGVLLAARRRRAD